MSHQRQMEWRQRRPPEEWRGYQRLGVAVIASAVQDLKKPTRAGKESGDMNTILRKYWPDAGPA
jgi:hypothetical protein